MENKYTMLMKITLIKTGKTFNLSYKLNDSNRRVDPIVNGWESAGYVVNSFNFVPHVESV
jgi:hypothetical protein